MIFSTKTGIISIALLLVLPTFPAYSETDEQKEEEAKQDKESKEAEDARLEEEQKIKEQFNYSFDDVYTNLVTISCRSEIGRSSGSGFIAKMDNKTYLFTNQHVIMGADKISFKSTSGETLKPRSVELSGSRDIARLLLEDRDDALEMAPKIGMGIPIGVFGNSEGAGVATELYGKVTGIGADLVEVTADFVSGNSGSPVLNLNKEVIGIASYVKFSRPSRMKEGTKFENKTRRFCYRMKNSEWRSVNWRQYNINYGKVYVANEQLISYLTDTFEQWGNDLLSSVDADDQYGKSVQYWAKSHNTLLGKQRSGKHQVNSQRFREEYRDSTKRLGKLCTTEAKKIDQLTQKPDLSGFLLDQFEMQVMTLEYFNDVCIFYGDLIYH